MDPAQMTAIRHLLGLSQSELADELDVTRYAVRDWERGKFQPRPGVIDDITALRARHDRAVARLTHEAKHGVPLEVDPADATRGWNVAIMSRVLDRVPTATITWADQ